MKILIGIVTILLLTGCASNTGYYESIDKSNEQRAAVEKARYESEQERYKALYSIAKEGTESAQIAAVMAIAMSAGTGSSTNVQMSTPAAPQNGALQWAQVLAAPLTNIGLGYFGMQSSINANNNARDVQLSSHGAFTAFGNNIQQGTQHGYQWINPPANPEPSVHIVEQPPYNDPVIVNQPPYNDPIIVEPIIIQQP